MEKSSKRDLWYWLLKTGLSYYEERNICTYEHEYIQELLCSHVGLSRRKT